MRVQSAQVPSHVRNNATQLRMQVHACSPHAHVRTLQAVCDGQRLARQPYELPLRHARRHVRRAVAALRLRRNHLYTVMAANTPSDTWIDTRWNLVSSTV